ncbi:DUF547 domain-containing protein [Catalinimonas niigatensis]|uniref:DUF547 domain-containing protein n=1 Tax=Catalinimonas niigatensis TaxID=1397264 RepID=UPI002665CAB3|nr:DUF547 domain-containing protein [Catalinimonas niigatensis]WPP52775.1 DUF547 domain-containing protein [Catalinimonas niigatensis]
MSLFLGCTSAEHAEDTEIYARVGEAKAYPLVNLSKELVRSAKQETDASQIIQKLANLSRDQLAEELDSDAAKKAFFINVYNGFVQHILMNNPEKFDDRGAFFSTEQITIAGEKLSLDDIEHGIIRGSKVKWSLGMIQDPFADDFEKTFRVVKTDGRIHFALNCGAKSCPYIAIYDATKIDEQLDIIAHQFLNRSSTYQAEEEKVYVTSLFSWFRGDFDGLDGVKDYLRRYEVIPEDADPELEFKEYDWTLELGNYTELDVKANKTTSSH